MHQTTEERFYSNINFLTPNGCWEWRGTKNTDGYGVFGFNGKKTKAYRTSYQWLVGPIYTGKQIDHLCRNHACVNPMHLEPVTQRENIKRGLSGVFQSLKTHCPKGHEYTPDNLVTYRLERGHRDCKTCANERCRQRREAKKRATV